jgi:hypothetical protein
MTDCTSKAIRFPRCKSRRVEAEFRGGEVSSDGGALLLSQVDRRMGLTRALKRVLKDKRVSVKVRHELATMLRQRIFGLCLGYEDLNDHQTLRKDPAFQTAVGTDRELASPPTLCRLENRADRAMALAIHGVLVDKFIESFDSPPRELVLDFDATDDEVHGLQEGRFFHGYYDHYCFLPLYVFCGEHLLAAYLRPSKIDQARHAQAVLSLLARRLCLAWPRVRLIFRADSGFCRPRMLSWCEREGLGYIVGLARNPRLIRADAQLIQRAEAEYERTGLKQRLFGEFLYAARTWDRTRRVVVKAEHSSRGSNPRFLVTNLEGDPRELYDRLYCQRGEMENRIKEQQLDLFADRTSCHKWWPNQLRLLLASLAYTLLAAIRRLALKGTDLARATCATIRLRLLKIGAVIIRNTRRVRFLMSSACPFQDLFRTAAARLKAG